MLKIQKVLVSFITLLSITSAFSTAPDSKQLKKRIAVFVFEDKTDKTHHWWDRKGVGEGLSEMLLTSLVKSGKYRVVERQEMESIMQEQKLGLTGLLTPESAAQAGKLLGVELAVMGAVTEYGLSESKKGGRFGGIGLGLKKHSAVIAVDCRLVNTSTGEIIVAESIRKKVSSQGIEIDTKKFSYENQKKFDESVIGKAARSAVSAVVELLDKNASKVAWQAKVITQNNGFTFINAGSLTGLTIGDTLQISRPGEELIDPDTGISLGSIESIIGKIEIIDANIGDGKAAKCQTVEGGGFQKGDIVKIE